MSTILSHKRTSLAFCNISFLFVDRKTGIMACITNCCGNAQYGSSGSRWYDWSYQQRFINEVSIYYIRSSHRLQYFLTKCVVYNVQDSVLCNNVAHPVICEGLLLGTCGEHVYDKKFRHNHTTQGRIQDFKLGWGAHLNKLSRAEEGTKNIGVFRVKNHDFTPKNNIFSNFRGGGELRVRPWIRPCNSRATLVTNTMINHEWGKLVIATNRTFPWSFVAVNQVMVATANLQQNH